MEGSLQSNPISYDPESISWRVNRESVLLLGGRRALLMQLAHPMVAQAVADHSRFTEDRIGRLLATLQLSFRIVFGPEEEARGAIGRINAVHKTVQGTLPDRAGPFPAGTRYRAEDPNLLMWVHATLIDSALNFYERFVTPLTSDERERFYLETWRGTNLLGIPNEIRPANFIAFQTYMENMIESDLLTITDTARELASEILYPPAKWIPRRLFDPLNIITIGMLPANIRDGYRLRWNRGRAAAFSLAIAALKGFVFLAPKPIRFVPAARAAEKRLAEPFEDVHA